MNQNNDILGKLPLNIRKSFEELFCRNQIALLPLSSRDLSTGKKSYDFRSYHHINIRIPYAGKLLKWEIIFNLEDYSFPPNFYFHDDPFLNDPDEDILAKEVPSLGKWSLRDSSCLWHVIKELMELYKKTQIDTLRRENIYSRFYEEYELLISENGVDSVEVSIDACVVTFLVALKIDCSDLPNYIQPIQWCNPGEDFAHLRISTSNTMNIRSGIFLQLSPHLEQVLGNMRNIAVPDLKKDSTVIEYVAAVNRMINNRIEIVAKHYKMKKAYILYVVAKCWETLIDYDTESLDRIAFLYKLDDYECLVTVRIGSKFPTEKPQVRLSSIYCQEGKNCNEILDKYPYNQASTPEINIDNLLEYLEDVVARFKNHQHQSV